MERTVPYRIFTMGLLTLGLAFGPGTAGRAFGAHRRCTGHNITNHGEVISGAVIKADVEIKVGAGDWVELRPDWSESLGYYCVPTNVSFKVTGSDKDTHICLNPPTTNTNLYNYIRDAELYINITNIEMSAGTRRRLSTPDEKVFTRIWSKNWSLPANVGGEWRFAFEGIVDDVPCVTVVEGQDHSSSVDSSTNMSLFEATLTVPVVRKIVAYRGNTALADSDDNATWDDRGVACIGPATLKAYSDAAGTEQKFPINPPRWRFLHIGPSGTLVTNLMSGAIVEHNFTNATVHRIDARTCVAGKTMYLTAVKVEISRPHGDPTLSATAWNNPDSDEANIGNERTFTGGNSSGVATVTVPCVALIEPASTANEIADRLRWSIDNVGPIKAVWNPHVDGDPHTGKGLSPSATFTTTAAGLPANNDAFGSKVVRLQVEDMDCAEFTTNVEIFYPRNSKNHAGGQAASPNWFHYWMQARPNPDVVFVPTLANFGAASGMLTDWIGASGYVVNPRKNRIEIGTAHPNKSKQYGVGKVYSGIDRMISTVIHEEKHVQQIAAADALMPPTDGNDSFRYGWSWNQATHNHWNEGPDVEWGFAGVDDDGSGTVDDATPLPPFEPGWPGSDDVSLDHPARARWPKAWTLPPPYADNPNLHPIEVEAVRHANDELDEHDCWDQDWGNPGKQHKTNQKWDD